MSWRLSRKRRNGRRRAGWDSSRNGGASNGPLGICGRSEKGWRRGDVLPGTVDATRRARLEQHAVFHGGTLRKRKTPPDAAQRFDCSGFDPWAARLAEHARILAYSLETPATDTAPALYAPC